MADGRSGGGGGEALQIQCSSSVRHVGFGVFVCGWGCVLVLGGWASVCERERKEETGNRQG